MNTRKGRLMLNAPPTTIRLRPDIFEEIAAIAEREGNTPAAVMRRVVSLGLEELRRRDGGAP